jgi:hypothetical protein
MSNSDKSYSSRDTGRRRKGVVPWLPLLAAIGTLITFVTVRGAQTQEWGGLKLVVPVESANGQEDQGEALFETGQPALVQASIGGRVSSLSERGLEITDGRLTVRYRGLFPSNLQTGQSVKAGEVIGQLKLGRPDPLVAKLWMGVARDSQAIAPPFKNPFESDGQRIYVMGCVGCHQMRKIQVLVGGKLRNGDIATEQSLAVKIRRGGKISKDDPVAMPPFSEEVLPDTELREVTFYLCKQEHRCGGGEGAK